MTRRNRQDLHLREGPNILEGKRAQRSCKTLGGSKKTRNVGAQEGAGRDSAPRGRGQGKAADPGVCRQLLGAGEEVPGWS